MFYACVSYENHIKIISKTKTPVFKVIMFFLDSENYVIKVFFLINAVCIHKLNALN